MYNIRELFQLILQNHLDQSVRTKILEAQVAYEESIKDLVTLARTCWAEAQTLGGYPKLMAVKDLKNRAGLGLLEAKNLIDLVEEEEKGTLITPAQALEQLKGI
jgi:ribosomal protein L7/L12